MNLLSLFLLLTSLPFTLYCNDSRGYSPFSHALPDGVTLVNDTEFPQTDSCRLASPLTDFSLTFRAVCPRHPFGFSVTPSAGPKIWITVSQKEVPDIISSSPALEINASLEGDAQPLASVSVTDGFDLHQGPNIWRLQSDNGMLTLSAGNRQLSKILSIPTVDNSLAAFSFTAAPGASLKVQDIILEGNPSTGSPQSVDVDALRTRLETSDDPIEGYWAVFDRNLEENLLRMGGDYRLAIVNADDSALPPAPSETATYNIVYLDGARVNAPSWLPGMIKGSLHSSPFPGIFSVTWLDANGLPLDHEIKAQTDAEGLLTIQFPYQNSTLRLRKILGQNPAPAAF